VRRRLGEGEPEVWTSITRVSRRGPDYLERKKGADRGRREKTVERGEGEAKDLNIQSLETGGD